MRRTESEAQATRDAILEAGVMLFAEAGYRATRLDEVAKRAGVTRGAVYHHFGDKPGVLTAIVERYIGLFDQSLDGSILRPSKQPDLPALLSEVIVEPLRLVESDTYVAAFFELVMLRASGEEELRQIRSRRRGLMEERIRLLSAAIGAGINAGELRNDIDPTAIALHIGAVQYGILASWIEFGKKYSLVEAGKIAALLTVNGVTRGMPDMEQD